MASKSLPAALNNFSWAHVPTWALLIGTAAFWLELYAVRLAEGHPSWLAWGMAGMFVLIWAWSKQGRAARFLGNSVRAWRAQSLAMKALIASAAFLGLCYLATGFYAALFPPHLVQESDALNYHIMLPRQHLLRHSFAHIPWSVPDLFLLPLDYALAPFELATPMPNKLIQFFFLIGALMCVFYLADRWSQGSKARAWTAVLAIMASHIVAIQVGTAMLDLVMVYCFLAFVHSLMTGRMVFAAIEFAFFAWSKSFVAPQMAVIGAGLGLVIYAALKNKLSLSEAHALNARQWKTFSIVFLIGSILIAGPHMAKSLYYAGTPLYPFAAGALPVAAGHTPQHWQAILQRADGSLSTKDAYGHGRSLADFIKHFWLIAVPETGVNNAFDYPVCILYLMILAPFLHHVSMSLKKRTLPVWSIMIMLWWATWWFGSQQTRFLLPPLCLMTVLAIAFMPRLSKIFLCLVVISLGLETISLVRAHRDDWGKSSMEVIRDKDKQLLALAQQGEKVPVELDFPDVAFAPFIVDVRTSGSVYVMPHWLRKINTTKP